MKARLAVILVALLASATGASASTVGAAVHVTEVPGTRFPARAYLLTLPENERLSASRITVLENGQRVSRLSLMPAADGVGGSGVVLAIDTSNSMAGRPIKAAIAAARTFVRRRAANQKLAIVTFDGTTRVLVPFTSDENRIDSALAEAPPLAKGTRLNDGVMHAVRLIQSSGVRFGTVVVLSDGADTGSMQTVAAVTSRARARGVRVFTVGLRSSTYDAAALESFARGTTASHAEASSTEELDRIYDDLGVLLSNEYLLTYLSLAEPLRDVDVEVRVRGYSGTAADAYRAPALPEVSEVTYHRSFGFRFWTSSGSMLLATLTIALLVGGVLAALVQPRNRTLRRRMASFVTLGLVRSVSDAAVRPVRMFENAERRLAGSNWWHGLTETLDVARIRIPALQLVLWVAAATTFVMWLLATLGGSLLFAPFAFVVPLVARTLVRNRLVRQRRLFADQLADNLQVMASAMRAGHSFVGALAAVVDDAAEPSRSEFERVMREEQLGYPLEHALESVVQRMESRDLEQVAVVSVLQREAGGNTAEVLDRVVDTVRSRAELRRLVRTLTAQGRMSRWVVSSLPPALLVLFTLLNPEFTGPLFTEMVGRFLLAFAAALVVIGSLVIKKIVEFEV